MENVHHDVGIVRHHPLAQGVPVHRHWLGVVLLFQSIAQFADDRLEMGLRRAGANDKEIREVGNPTEIDGDDVLGFFFGNELRAKAGE